MPEMVLLCGDESFTCTAVSVKSYRRYTEIMERNTGESAAEAFDANMQILKEVFSVTGNTLSKADAVAILSTSKMIHFVMQDVIGRKFLELNPERAEPEEREESAFDEYDEENGYNDLEAERKNIWKILRDNLDRVVKMCIRVMKNSYQDCMDADIITLLDYVAFELRTIKENERK